MSTSEIKAISFTELLAGKVADGSKTMTRRLVKHPSANLAAHDRLEIYGNRALFGDGAKIDAGVTGGWPIVDFKYRVGQILYVREPHWAYGDWELNGKTKKRRNSYRFVHNDYYPVLFEKPDDVIPNDLNILGYYKRLARFMPKRFARTFLRVTDVRCERLHDIPEEDAIAEGVHRIVAPSAGPGFSYDGKVGHFRASHVSAFQDLFVFAGKIKIDGNQYYNPWVWVISFERVDAPK